MLLSLGSSCWVVCGLVCLQGQIPKRHQFRRDWTPCSKYVDHSRLNIQHNYGHLHDHLMSMKIFSLILNKMFIWAPKIMVKWLRPMCRFAKHLKHPTVGANGHAHGPPRGIWAARSGTGDAATVEPMPFTPNWPPWPRGCNDDFFTPNSWVQCR